MPRQPNLQLRDEAIKLREEGRLRANQISEKLGVSEATLSRWLKEHPLTREEIRQFKASTAARTSTGRKQSLETIQKRVEKSREKIRKRALERFGGAWVAAKENGQIKYTSNHPCEYGHTERYVKSRECTECEFNKHRDPSRRYLRLFVGARYRSRTQELPFDLTVDYIKQIWPEDNRCPIFGIELTSPHQGRGKITNNSPTLDRIKPHLGYVQGNVAILSYQANSIKRDCTDPAVFRRIADWLESQLCPKRIGGRIEL